MIPRQPTIIAQKARIPSTEFTSSLRYPLGLREHETRIDVEEVLSWILPTSNESDFAGEVVERIETVTRDRVCDVCRNNLIELEREMSRIGFAADERIGVVLRTSMTRVDVQRRTSIHVARNHPTEHFEFRDVGEVYAFTGQLATTAAPELRLLEVWAELFVRHWVSSPSLEVSLGQRPRSQSRVRSLRTE